MFSQMLSASLIKTFPSFSRCRKSDGRVEVVALINVYVPRAADSEARRHYKLKFLALLQTRAEALVTSGRYALIAGFVYTHFMRMST